MTVGTMDGKTTATVEQPAVIVVEQVQLFVQLASTFFYLRQEDYLS